MSNLWYFVIFLYFCICYPWYLWRNEFYILDISLYAVFLMLAFPDIFDIFKVYALLDLFDILYTLDIFAIFDIFDIFDILYICDPCFMWYPWFPWLTCYLWQSFKVAIFDILNLFDILEIFDLSFSLKLLMYLQFAIWYFPFPCYPWCKSYHFILDIFAITDIFAFLSIPNIYMLS